MKEFSPLRSAALDFPDNDDFLKEMESICKAYAHTYIRKELKKYSWRTVKEFERIFPVDGNYTLEVWTTEYDENTADYWDLTYVDMVSPKNFWDRWNKFKKLKAFL
jgi:hypothetical protein